MDKIIKLAFDEDFGKKGDITSQAIFSDEVGSYILVSKDKGILCGSEIFKNIFNTLDENCNTNFYYKDGDRLKSGDNVAKVTGKIAVIMKAERTALNFLSLLSGIATKVDLFVKKVHGKVQILDTRKTIPGLRTLQKYAVRCGGGYNHRMGLYDMVMIKDNHIDGAGSITNAVKNVRAKWGNSYKIEVETRNLKEVKEALECKVDRIMLDNMDLEKMKEAVQLINNNAKIEASGNMSLNRIEEIADIAIDFISVGSLTHTVKAFDFSLIKQIE